MSSATSPRLVFVACFNNEQILNTRLLASPCLLNHRYPIHLVSNQASAGHAYNGFTQGTPPMPENTWWVWIHQDVYLPEGWDRLFIENLEHVQSQFTNLAVVGLYGVAGHAPHTVRAGKILDRGKALYEATPLPFLVDSVDELLIATRADLHIGFDPALGFDLYGTDVVLSAQARNLVAAVIEAPCEHWSDTPSLPPFPPALIERITRSANAFETKWQNRLPLATPCFEIDRIGAVNAFFVTHS